MSIQSAPDIPEGLYRYDRTAQSVLSPDHVRDEHIDFFAEYGYLVVEHLFDAEEVRDAIEGLLFLIGGGNSDFEGVQFEKWAADRQKSLPAEVKQDYVRKLRYHSKFDERLKRMTAHPKLLDLVGRLLGGKPELFQDMALIKPPGGGREKPWHQDKAYFEVAIDEPVVGAWIALDPATAANGCMHIIPSSHRNGPVVHFRRRDWQICDTEVNAGRDVMVPLPPGGCLFFDGLLHHGTPPNRSSERRRALQFHYARADAKWVTRDDRMAIFGSEGKDVEC